MAKIQSKIEKQHFEIVRDRIGAIIQDELDNQLLNFGNYTFDASVTIEGDNHLTDKTELPSINVSLNKGSWDNENQGSSDGTYIFDIDFYVNAKTNPNSTADTFTAKRMQRLAGAVRAILKNPIYRTLDFTTPFIMRTTCSEFNIRQRTPEDAWNTSMGRISFVVKANETTSLIEAIKVEDAITRAYLGNTTQGYQYEIYGY